MADETTMTTDPTTPDPATAPAGTPDNPMSVTIVNPAVGPGGTVFPTPGIDETVQGGAYRKANGAWIDAEGRDIKAPRGKS